MRAADILFYVLALFSLVFGLLAVTTRHIFRAGIYLLFTLIGIAGIYFWMSYEFIAAVQIVVYVGGIVVLILFSILLTQKAGEQLPVQRGGRKWISALAAACGLGVVLSQLFVHHFVKSDQPVQEPDLTSIGSLLLNVNEEGLALPFEVISILLLAAMLGCIVIALRKSSPEDTNANP
jgi:NADH-quinone oxidoreductase subunit J